LQPSLDRTVAVKVLTEDLDEESLERFQREHASVETINLEVFKIR